MRKAVINRKTAETDIKLSLQLDGTGASKIDSGVGFLDHMLTLLAVHGHFDLDLFCKGDTNVDYHHSVEDIGIVLGQAFCQALGDKKGIQRYGDMVLPMDETLILVVPREHKVPICYIYHLKICSFSFLYFQLLITNY